MVVYSNKLYQMSIYYNRDWKNGYKTNRQSFDKKVKFDDNYETFYFSVLQTIGG